MGGGGGVRWVSRWCRRRHDLTQKHPQAAAPLLRSFCARKMSYEEDRVSYRKEKGFRSAFAGSPATAAAEDAPAVGTVRLAMQRSGRLTDETQALLHSVGLAF